MAKRIITTDVLEEDKKIEGSLRPQTLNEYIGQAKANLAALKKQAEPHQKIHQRIADLEKENAELNNFIMQSKKDGISPITLLYFDKISCVICSIGIITGISF